MKNLHRQFCDYFETPESEKRGVGVLSVKMSFLFKQVILGTCFY